MASMLDTFVSIMERDKNLKEDDWRWLQPGELLQLDFNFSRQQWEEEVLDSAITDRPEELNYWAERFAETPVSVNLRIQAETEAEVSQLIIETVLDVEIDLQQTPDYYQDNIYDTVANFNNIEYLQGPKAEAVLTSKAVIYNKNGEGDLYLESRLPAEPLLGADRPSEEVVLNLVFERAAWTSTVATLWLLGKQGEIINLKGTSFTNQAIFSGKAA